MSEKQHHRKTLAPELIALLGMQTRPYSPTAYVLGKRYQDAFVPLRDDNVFLQLPGLDHATCWTKKGRRIVISEPYGISFKMMREMIEFADLYGLECHVDPRFESWNPGACAADRGPARPARAGGGHAQAHPRRARRTARSGSAKSSSASVICSDVRSCDVAPSGATSGPAIPSAATSSATRSRRSSATRPS